MQNIEWLRNIIGTRIKKLRQNRGLSLKQLADMAGYDLTNLSKLENGKIGFSESALSKLSEALVVPPADLFTDTDLPPVYWASKYGTPDERIPTHLTISSKSLYVVVQDDAMAPRICRGDFAIIDPEAPVSSTRAQIIAAVVTHAGREEVIIRRQQRVQSLPPFPDDDQTWPEFYELHGKVIVNLISENDRVYPPIRISGPSEGSILGAVVEIIVNIA